MRVDVAALGLANVTDVCWDLRVTNAPGGGGEVVATRGAVGTTAPADTTALCASRYGAAGSLSYVAPCDAGVATDSSVTIWLDSIFEEGSASPATDFRDPCPSGCTVDVACEEATRAWRSTSRCCARRSRGSSTSR